jgi:transposase-like protein
MEANLLAPEFQDADKAREALEAERWPDGPICPHCGVIGEATRLETEEGTKTHARKGLWNCNACRKQFTVTIGTIFEDSHIPLNKWLLAIHLMCASKKGMSAHQLHRMLGIGYRAAWFMAHRIRHGMAENPLPSFKMKGPVEVDETYIGGKEHGRRGRPGASSKKTPVLALVERGGRVQSMPMERVTAENLREVIGKRVRKDTRIMTDEFQSYRHALGKYPKHEMVTHSAGEYVRGDVHTNTVEGYFSLLKRGIHGTFHHVSKHHLHRYLAEFDFRYNAREVSDAERAQSALKGIGKRLMYRESVRKG